MLTSKVEKLIKFTLVDVCREANAIISPRLPTAMISSRLFFSNHSLQSAPAGRETRTFHF